MDFKLVLSKISSHSVMLSANIFPAILNRWSKAPFLFDSLRGSYTKSKMELRMDLNMVSSDSVISTTNMCTISTTTRAVALAMRTTVSMSMDGAGHRKLSVRHPF